MLIAEDVGENRVSDNGRPDLHIKTIFPKIVVGGGGGATQPNIIRRPMLLNRPKNLEVKNIHRSASAFAVNTRTNQPSRAKSK